VTRPTAFDAARGLSRNGRNAPAVLRTIMAVALAGIVGACGPAASSGNPASNPVASATTATTASTSPSPAAGPTIELTVYAAASLSGPLDALQAAYAVVAPDIKLTISAGASSALRAQVEQGAPADVFLSADTTNPAALVAVGLTAGEAKLIAANRLAIIVPTANPAAVRDAADLARPGLKIVAAGEAVPITRYADELVGKLTALEGYPSGFAEGYAANIVSREDDVKAVVAKIELGEGDAAIVYATDALASDAVTTLDVPVEAAVTASYAGAVIGRSPHLKESRAFLDWLNGSDAQEILGSFGFLPPGT
jgi:molybdate transport system substrate-binding protein